MPKAQPDPAVSAPGDAARFCVSCGYDLRGITSERCPECGFVVGEGMELVVPWQIRSRIGYARAILGTLFLAIARPSVLAMAVAGHVDGVSARRFRWLIVGMTSCVLIAVFLAAVKCKGGTAFLSVTDPRGSNLLSWFDSPLREMALTWSAGATLVPVLPVGLIATFILCTRAASPWFRLKTLDDERQSRAVAMSRYACAAMVFLPLGILPWLPLIDWGFYRPWLAHKLEPEHWIAIVSVPLLIVVLVWRCTLVLLARTTHCSIGRLAAAAVFIPLSWVASAAVGLGLLPALVGLTWIAIDSLRP